MLTCMTLCVTRGIGATMAMYRTVSTHISRIKSHLSNLGLQCMRAVTLVALCRATGAKGWLVATVCVHVKFIVAFERGSAKAVAERPGAGVRNSRFCSQFRHTRAGPAWSGIFDP